MLHVDLQVVLEVLAHTREVVDDWDAEGTQLIGVADAGQLQRLRCVDRAAAQDHLAAEDAPALPRAVRVVHSHRARPWNRIRLTIARVRISRFGRLETGWR